MASLAAVAAALYLAVDQESFAAALLAELAFAASASTVVAVELLSEPLCLSVACVYTMIFAEGPYSEEAASVALSTVLCVSVAERSGPSLPVGWGVTDSSEPNTAAFLLGSLH